MISDLFTLTVLVGIAHSGIRLATPYLFAALGETFAQRSGVLNLGVDGIMLMGAFSAFYVVYTTGNLWLGVLAAIVVGGVMGLLMAVVSVTMQAEQGISGIGLYLFGLGLSSLLFKTMIGSVASVNSFQKLRIPFLSDLPLVGEIFFNHNILVYLAYLAVPASWFVLNRTTLGLKIRAVGHNPEAADSLGVSVNGVRYFTLILGGGNGRSGRRFVEHWVAQCFSRKYDQRAGLHRRGPGLFWRMAARGRVGRGAALQHGQRLAALGSGAEPAHPLGPGRDDALCAHHRRPGFRRAPGAATRRPHQAV